MASVRDHHPDAGCSIVVVDLDDHAAVPSDHDVMTLADLGFDIDEVHRRRAMYDVLELATSVKAAALAELLARGATTAVYFDPDIVLYRPLVELEGIATTNQIVLTPHVLSPLPMDGRYVGDLTIHSAGVFNLGFVAVSADAGPFLEFWDQRLRRMCRVDPASGVFVDQRWVDQVPALFPHTVVRDRGWNVAYWNLYERPLTRAADGMLVAGDQPLRFFHFSGHDPFDGVLLSRYQGFPTVLLSEHPLVAELCRDWRDRVLGRGHRPLAEAGNGLELTPLLRRVFNEACLKCEEAEIPPPPSPATPGGMPAFVDWCHGPSPWMSVGEVPALLHALWFLRPDIQAAFPSPSGAEPRGVERLDPRRSTHAGATASRRVAGRAGRHRWSTTATGTGGASATGVERGRLLRVRTGNRRGRAAGCARGRGSRVACRNLRRTANKLGPEPRVSAPRSATSAVRHHGLRRQRRSDRRCARQPRRSVSAIVPSDNRLLVLGGRPAGRRHGVLLRVGRRGLGRFDLCRGDLPSSHRPARSLLPLPRAVAHDTDEPRPRRPRSGRRPLLVPLRLRLLQRPRPQEPVGG